MHGNIHIYLYNMYTAKADSGWHQEQGVWLMNKIRTAWITKKLPALVSLGIVLYNIVLYNIVLYNKEMKTDSGVVPMSCGDVPLGWRMGSG